MTMLSLQTPLTYLIADLGLSAGDVAAALGVDARAVERWRSAGSVPQREARGRLQALLSLVEHLNDTFTTTAARRAWLHAASDYLGGFTRAEILRTGRIDRVEADLVGLDAGIFD